MFGSAARRVERERAAGERAAAREAVMEGLGRNVAGDRTAEMVRGDGMTFGTEAEVLRQRAAKARAEVRRDEGDRLEREAGRRS